MKRLLLTISILTMSVFAKGAEEVVEHYLKKIEIGRPIEYKNLKVFPLICKDAGKIDNLAIQDEAMNRGWLKIKEAGSGEVNFVEVKNSGKRPVFMMTGELISGAKQDRMIKEDVLCPPNNKWIRIPVYCVEHGRWTQMTPEFKTEKLAVPNAVRKEAKITESQSGVWAEIAKSQDRMGITAGTGTVRANYEAKGVQKELAQYTEKFERLPKFSNSTIGVVATTDNRIICLDVFANNNLLRKIWGKLIKSYAMDAISSEKGDVDKANIEDLLKTLSNARFVSTGTPGLGKLIKIESEAGKGSALCYKSMIVHLDFFPKDDIIDDSGLRLDFRRDERMDR